MSGAAGFMQKLAAEMNDISTARTAEKGDFILREGETERHLYWIASGAVRVCYLTDSEEHTIRLGYEGSFINSLSSFLKDAPSEFYIEALRRTELRVIPKQQLLDIAHRNPVNLSEYASLLELLVTQQIDREIDLLISSPAERFNRVLQRSPQLFQHVPLKYIASYLRMTPETLSRIRIKN